MKSWQVWRLKKLAVKSIYVTVKGEPSDVR